MSITTPANLSNWMKKNEIKKPKMQNPMAESPSSVAGIPRQMRRILQVFDTTPENVLMHLRNVLASGGLEANATTEEFLVVRTEGTRRVRRTLKHDNLDAIVSVGCRVNSRRGVRFRQWATRALRDHRCVAIR